jgi:hypothetical protein
MGFNGCYKRYAIELTWDLMDVYETYYIEISWNLMDDTQAICSY